MRAADRWAAELERDGNTDAVAFELTNAETGSACAPPTGALAVAPLPRVLFFESLMNSEMEHNDQEISQGVVHMASAARAAGAEVVLARVKMSITRQFRVGGVDTMEGLDTLEAALSDGPVGLVCITLLEAYFDGVMTLIERLRALGCRAHIAVGGVMPTLTPEHVAVHLPDVSFVCRGAGEYFLPRLCRIVGQSTIDEPFSPGQRAALLVMDGLLAIDRKGRRLIRANDAHSVQVDSLDNVRLDLSVVQRRHLVHGLEIATSRGCIHRCSFCTIMGQMTYQARSAEGIFELLRRYEARFAELFGEDIPDGVFRLHISDDDFACDAARASTFFRALTETRFRLASCQISVADLCQKDGARLTAEPREELLSALRPGLFFDHLRSIPKRAHIEDHGPRNWSAYLQLGVESFQDDELRRHAKGYRVAHVRAVVGALSERGIHHDAYFILSNGETTAAQLIEGLTEVVRLKLAYPVHFHVRYPITPRLVSVVPSASHRRHLKKGQASVMVVRHRATVPGYPEYDYPFVEHDRALDPWVEAAVSADFFTHDQRYGGSLERLQAVWRERLAGLDGAERAQGEAVIRAADDVVRRLIFEGLSANSAVIAEAALEILGPQKRWMAAYRRWQAAGPATLVYPSEALRDRCEALLSSTHRAERTLRAADAPRFTVTTETLSGLGAVAGAGPLCLGSDVEPSALTAALNGLRSQPGAWSIVDPLSPTLVVDDSGSIFAARPDGHSADRTRCVGHLDDLKGFDAHWCDADTAPPTAAVKVFHSFARWWQSRADD